MADHRMHAFPRRLHVARFLQETRRRLLHTNTTTSSAASSYRPPTRQNWPTLAALTLALYGFPSSLPTAAADPPSGSELPRGAGTVASDSVGQTSVKAGSQLLSFTHDVMPVLTKAGCNVGVCHAKAGGGQRGFQLSVLGFEPRDDYESLVKQGRGRRVSLAAPERSLLVLKATGQVPHGGGVRIASESAAHRTLVEWLRQGAAFTIPGAPTLEAFMVAPARGFAKQRTTQPLRALARYSDGTQRDVTADALFEANDTAFAEVDGQGLVQVLDRAGKFSIMVRYQGRVAVFNASVPLGAPVLSLPPARNFIDELVFANLRELGIPPSPICDDATFLRRVTLDICGRVPTEREATDFLASSQPDKRDAFVDELLRTPEYADFFASKWNALLKNRRDDASDIVSNFAFHAWVRDSLLANKPYDQFVRELLAATGEVLGNPPVAWYKRVKEPKQQIEDVAQLFLGVRMQ